MFCFLFLRNKNIENVFFLNVFLDLLIIIFFVIAYFIQNEIFDFN